MQMGNAVLIPNENIEKRVLSLGNVIEIYVFEDRHARLVKVKMKGDEFVHPVLR